MRNGAAQNGIGLLNNNEELSEGAEAMRRPIVASRRANAQPESRVYCLTLKR
jgi:hypothetical protein